ncbi:MAG: hypothetical protein H7323_15835 [Frankiales bacterium]|nr:hypothetical protein [Frankiales bacterium]
MPARPPQLAVSIAASSRLSALLPELPAPTSAAPLIAPARPAPTPIRSTPTALAIAPYADLGPSVVLLVGALGGLVALARRRQA